MERKTYQDSRKRRRTTSDDENLNVEPNKRKSTQDIKEQLKELGRNIASVSDQSKETDQVAIQKFEEIQEEFNRLFQDAFQEAMLEITQTRIESEATSAAAMAEEERLQQVARTARNIFLDKMRIITDRMTTELTVDQQEVMYNQIITRINHELAKAYDSSQPQEPNHLARLTELTSIMYTYASEQLSITLSNVYQRSPEIITQTIAILTATGMIYTYLPHEMRNGFTNLEYFGGLFTLMNRLNPELLLVQNSAATVTTIFYLLKNAGIDTSSAIESLGSFAVEAYNTTATSATSTASAATRATLTVLQNTSTKVLNIITDRLGEIITSEYQTQNLMTESQETTLTPSLETSIVSQQSVRSVEMLLNTPIEQGGIDLSGAANPQNIVTERITPIVYREEMNPIIAREIPLAKTAIQVATPIHSDEFVDSQVSEMTSDSEDQHWSVWLFGSSRGGKRIRKSRRHIKMRRTRKGRKGRKGCITKKGRKHHRTIKRYKSKGHH